MQDCAGAVLLHITPADLLLSMEGAAVPLAKGKAQRPYLKSSTPTESRASISATANNQARGTVTVRPCISHLSCPLHTDTQKYPNKCDAATVAHPYYKFSRN